MMLEIFWTRKLHHKADYQSYARSSCKSGSVSKDFLSTFGVVGLFDFSQYQTNNNRCSTVRQHPISIVMAETSQEQSE